MLFSKLRCCLHTNGRLQADFRIFQERNFAFDILLVGQKKDVLETKKRAVDDKPNYNLYEDAKTDLILTEKFIALELRVLKIRLHHHAENKAYLESLSSLDEGAIEHESSEIDRLKYRIKFLSNLGRSI
jgi:hypothetical protein